MNHAYRLVWNDHAQRYVPAPETARARGKSSAGKALIKPLAVSLAALFAAPALAAPPAASALPQDGLVTAGQASISQSGSRMDITQSSDRAILEWNRFDIGAQAQVNFNQPNAASVALNRVIAGEASQIHGQLTANGQVWLINPSGVVFGKGSHVDVGGLVASTLDTLDSDFLAGKAEFHRGDATGNIVNQGKITARDGGLVALLAPEVRNEGVIAARLGNVVLTAGDRVTLDAGADGFLKVAVNPATVATLVENRHLIQADGGQVVLTSRAADALLASIVANTGTVQARTLENRAGRILLLADMEHGEVRVGGTLDASAPSLPSPPGRGAGGEGATPTEAQNGGFIETSAGRVRIADGTQVTTQAGNGPSGTWLIDPHDYTIAASGGDISGATLSANLANGNIEIQSSQGAAEGNGDIHVNDAVSWSANTLTLTAARDININAVMTASGSSKLVMNGTTKVGFAPGLANGFAGRVDFPGRAGTGFLTINGQGYTVINSLGAEGSTTGTDLQGIQGNRYGYYALGSDIDASSTVSWGGGAGFEPIGFVRTGYDPYIYPDGVNTMVGDTFYGVFNGLGHTVNGLTINRPSTYAVGLFGITGRDAYIANVGIVGGAIHGDRAVGGVIGKNSTAANIGDFGVTPLYNVYNTASISGNKRVGGVVGYWYGGRISNIYNIGTVTAGDYVGGLVGSQVGGPIIDSYNTGAVSGNLYVAGLSGDGLYAVNSHYDIDAVTINGGHFVTHGGMYTAQFQDWVNQGKSLNIGDYLALAGDGYYTLNSAQNLKDLLGFSEVSGLKFRLEADIDLVGLPNWHIPLFAAHTMDGDGHTLSNLSITQPFSSYVGFVGYLSGTLTNLTLSNVSITGGSGVGGLAGGVSGTVSNSASTGSVTGVGSVGGLIGDLGYSASVSNSHSTGTVNGNDHVGGLVGSGRYASIRNSYSTASVSGTNNVGGLAGYNYGGNINDSYASGAVNGSSNVGGLVGFNYGCCGYGDLRNSYSTGSVTGTSNVGGLVGLNYGGAPTNSYWNTETSGQATSAGGLGLTTSQMRQQASFSGWDFDTVWRIYEGQSNPVLRTFQRDLTVTANDATRTYDGQAYSGGNGVSYSVAGAALAGTLSYAGNSQGAVNVGSYVIAPSAAMTQQDFQNWHVTFADGTLTIDPAALTLLAVGADNKSKTYGNPDPALTWQLTTGALVQGDNFSGSLTRDAGENVGDYAIRQGTLTAGGNYTIDFSNGVLSITPAALTVTANAASKTYDGQAYSGGNGVSYSGFVNSETSAVLGGTLAYGGTSQNAINTGSYTITPSGLSSSNYAIAFNDGTLTINSAALTVTANAASKTYDGLAYSGGNGVNYSGFVNGETSAALGGTLAYGGSSQAATQAGSYVIAPSGLTSGNYAIAFNDGTLTINPAALTVTANAASKTYDGLAYSGGNGVSYSGFVNGETSAALDGTLAYGGNSQGATHAGTSIIAPSGLTSGNYAIAFNDGTLTINPAALTVTANATSKTYDGQAYSGGNGVSYSGFVSSETSAVLGGTLAYGGTSQNAINAGSYAITPSGLTSSNYAIDFNDGTLTIDPAALTVTANATSKTYDGLAYSGGNGVSYSGFVNGETSAVLDGTLAYGGSSQGARNAGGYVITPSGLTSGNYTLSFANGGLTITPRPVAVMPDDGQGKSINEADPVLTYATESGTSGSNRGVLAGDDLALTGALARAPGETTADSPYPIVIGTLQAGNGNYTLTLSDGRSFAIRTRNTDQPGAGDLLRIASNPDTEPPFNGNNSGLDFLNGALSMAPEFIRLPGE